MTPRLHKRQLGVIQVAFRVQRADIRVTHKQAGRLDQRHQVAAEVDQRVGVALDFQRLPGRLLRLQQRAALAGRYGVRERQDNPAAGNAAAAVAEAPRVVVHRASIIAGVEVDQALSYFVSVATLPPPLMASMSASSLLVGKYTQREARHAGALNGD